MHLQGLMVVLSLPFSVFSWGNCPLKCSCNKNHINCSDRSLISLNELDFGLIQSFDYVDISRNKLSHLSYLEVKFINASANVIQNFPDIADGVESLSLRYNLLREVLSENCPSSLRTLDLSENPLKHIDIACDGLIELDISHCDIDILSEFLLKKLRNLQKLNIGDNPLKKINGNLHSFSLQELRVERTQLRFIKPNILSSLTELKFLDLSGNQHLHSLDLIADAEILIAQNCSLEKVDLSRMSNLRTAVLDHNMIKEIYFLPSLTALHASYNLISYISLDNLMIADLSHNLLTSLRLRPMEWLNISWNQITRLKLTSMRVLDASHCKIKIVETSNSKFHMLNISHNDLEEFSGSLSATHLDVSYNRLSAFRNWIDGILEIRLSGNRLVLAEDVIAQGRMYLNDNPWTCDCKMDHLYRLAEDLNNLMCTHPRNVTGRTWADACYRSRIPRWMLRHPYIPFIISTGFLLFSIFCFYWIRKKLDTPDIQNTDQSEQVETVLPQIAINDQLPSYEEALLMPGITRKVNVVTQTRSYEVLSRRFSSNSI